MAFDRYVKFGDFVFLFYQISFNWSEWQSYICHHMLLIRLVSVVEFEQRNKSELTKPNITHDCVFIYSINFFLLLCFAIINMTQISRFIYHSNPIVNLIHIRQNYLRCSFKKTFKNRWERCNKKRVYPIPFWDKLLMIIIVRFFLSIFKLLVKWLVIFVERKEQNPMISI